MRRFFISLAAAGVLSAPAITAHAHATLEQTKAAPGPYKAVLRIPHGCDGQATHTVRVEIPEGYVGVKPMPKPGWTLAIEKGDYARTYELHGTKVSSGTKALIWKDGDLPDDHYDEFVMRGTLAAVEEGQTLRFKTTQECADGAVAWFEIPADGEDPHALEHPAPALTILAAGESGHGDHGGHGGAMSGEPVTLGDLTIDAAWARAMLPGQPAGGGYVAITNNGDEADRLISASSPAAGKVEVHSMEMKDGVMVMRPVEGGLEIPPGETIELKPGGQHLMFMQVGEPFAEGGSVPVELTFERAGSVEIVLPIRAARGGGHGNH